MFENTNTLINQYNQYKLQAHSAFMYGQEKEASLLYELAFEANKNIFEQDVTQESINRSLEICLDCLDFCLCDEEKNSSYYLNKTADIFKEIIEGSYKDALRKDALIAYSEISMKAHMMPHCYGSSEYLQNLFKTLCYKNKDLLK